MCVCVYNSRADLLLVWPSLQHVEFRYRYIHYTQQILLEMLTNKEASSSNGACLFKRGKLLPQQYNLIKLLSTAYEEN